MIAERDEHDCQQGGAKKKGKSLHVGGDVSSNQMKGWRPELADADEALLPEKELIDARVRDAGRNWPMLSGTTRQERATVIGSRVRLSSKPIYQALNLSIDWAHEFAKTVEILWMRDMEDPECWCDAAGKQTFSGLMGLGFMSYMANGEACAKIEYLEKPDRRSVKTALNMVDPIRLATPRNKQKTEHIRSGIESNRFGSPTHYWIASRKRTLSHYFSSSLLSDRDVTFSRHKRSTDWGRPNFVHVYDKELPGQTRGCPAFSSALRKMRMLDTFQDAALDAAVRDAMFALWVESDFPNIFQAFTSPNAAQNLGEVEDHLMSEKEEFYGENPLKFNGSNVPHLRPGEEIKTNQAAHPNGNYSGFVEAVLRDISRSIELDYAAFTGDYTKANYSGLRAGFLQTWYSRYYKRDLIFTGLGTPILTAWMEEKIADGELSMPIRGGISKHLDYFYKHRRALTNSRFYGPGQKHIDPVKGVKAAREEMGMNAMSLEQYCFEFTGEYWWEVVDQKKREQAYLKEQGLVEEPSVLGSSANDRVPKKEAEDE